MSLSSTVQRTTYKKSSSTLVLEIFVKLVVSTIGEGTLPPISIVTSGAETPIGVHITSPVERVGEETGSSSEPF